MNKLLLKRYPKTHDRIRRYTPYGLLIGAMATVAFVKEKDVLTAEVAWGVTAILLISWAYYWSRRASNVVDGKIVDYVFTPTPMGSLGNSLGKQGITFDQVDTITVMSADLNETKGYLKRPRNGDEPFLSVVEKYKDMQVIYFGYSKNPAIQSDHPRIKFIPISEKFTEHKNLITTKNNGPSFMWYEPCHDIVDGQDYFGGGAYLIALTETGKKQAEAIFQKLPRISAPASDPAQAQPAYA